MPISNPKPTVSILLSNYNGSPYLYTSLEGICNQTHPADEIIIIDDGSKDRSLEIIKKYSKIHKNIEVLVNKENKGLIYSINRALNESKSDYIIWAASDDYLMPHFLERSLETLEKYPKAGICFSQFAVFIDGTTQKRIYSKSWAGAAFDLGDEPHFLNPEMFYNRLKRSYLWMSGNTILARRDALLEMHGFLSLLRWHADWFAFLIIAMRYGLCIVPEVLTFMRERPQSYSRNGIKNRQQQADVLKSLLFLIKSEEFKDVQHFFRDCPSLFTPFGMDVFFMMIKSKQFYLAYKYVRFQIDFPFIRRKCLFVWQYQKSIIYKFIKKIYQLILKAYKTVNSIFLKRRA